VSNADRGLSYSDRRRLIAGEFSMPTLFERIIAGELPAAIVHRDERVIAFRDIRPLAPTHILVVPNKPIPTANDIGDDDEALVGHMMIGGRPLGPMLMRQERTG